VSNLSSNEKVPESGKRYLLFGEILILRKAKHRCLDNTNYVSVYLM